jgi:hypothetical protein
MSHKLRTKPLPFCGIAAGGPRRDFGRRARRGWLVGMTPVAGQAVRAQGSPRVPPGGRDMACDDLG